jgi:pseudouridine-5'-phosphate glycosidase
VSAVRVGADVAAALSQGGPVVALESTLIVHGLPHPENLEVAWELEAAVRDEGAVPATVAVVGGVPTVGTGLEELERLTASSAAKLGVRDLAPALVAERDGATTVSGTAHLASLAGSRVFATGGLGGVHRGARDSWDESADLMTLTRLLVAVVCAGIKSILDVPATLERLETLGVPVIGYGTNRLPGFYVRDAGHDLEWRVDGPADAAHVVAAHHALGGQGLLFVNPPPEHAAIDPRTHDDALATALGDLEASGLRGKDATPFLLARVHELTGGAAVEANAALALSNARVAARIAVELSNS